MKNYKTASYETFKASCGLFANGGIRMHRNPEIDEISINELKIKRIFLNELKLTLIN